MKDAVMHYEAGRGCEGCQVVAHDLAEVVDVLGKGLVRAGEVEVGELSLK